MEKSQLVAFITEGCSLRELSRRTEKSLGSIKYWLKKHDLKTRNKQSRKGIRQSDPHPCAICLRETDARRRMCNSCRTRIRRYRTKQAAVSYKGGKCGRCGWKENIAGLQFHHPNNDKEFEIGTAANKSWESIIQELDKCELLCANCHAVEHAENTDEVFLAEVSNYNGKLLGSVAEMV